MTQKIALGLTLIAAFFLGGLFLSLAVQCAPLITQSGWRDLIHPVWNYPRHLFGSTAMLWGSLIVSLLALGLAGPLSLASAIFISEFLHGKPRAVCKTIIELLAGIPSVVYGLIGVRFLCPLLEPLSVRFGGVSGDSMWTAGVLLAVMILPTLTTFSDDALRCVPKSFREAALGLGFTRAQTVTRVVLPHARSGILGAALLGVGRAFGETIAIYLVIGRSDRFAEKGLFSLKSLFEAGQTLTTKLGGPEVPIAYGDSRHWSSIMVLCLLLWFATGILNYAGDRFIKRSEILA